jgi:hypothetical protein
MENVCCYFDGRVDLWSALEMLKEEGYRMFVPEELLMKFEVSCVHYIVENKTAWDSTCPLSGVDSNVLHNL